MRAAIAILSIIVLSGCANNPYRLGRTQNGDLLSYTNGTNQIPVTKLDPEPILRDSLDTRKVKELADTLMDRSDVYCQDYLTGVSILNNGVTSGLDLTALTLSSVVPVVGPTATKNVLSAVAAIATGSKSVLTNDLLGGKEYGLIHDAIINGRMERRKAIDDEISAGSLNGWSQEAVLAHIQPYHVGCGIEFGLQYLRAAVTKQSQANPNGTALTDNSAGAETQAKAATANAEETENTAAAAKLSAGKLAKEAADAATAAAGASSDQKPSATANAQVAQATADAAQTLATRRQDADDLAKKAKDAWDDASTKAAEASKAYVAAKAATTLSNAAQRDADEFQKSVGRNDAPK